MAWTPKLIAYEEINSSGTNFGDVGEVGTDEGGVGRADTGFLSAMLLWLRYRSYVCLDLPPIDMNSAPLY
jgi:hypothetical protein